MSDIKCPWCKQFMEPKGAEYDAGLKLYIGSVYCPKCGATGPVCRAASPYEATDGGIAVALEYIDSDIKVDFKYV